MYQQEQQQQQHTQQEQECQQQQQQQLQENNQHQPMLKATCVQPEEIKLHRAKDPWRPSRFQIKSMADEDDKTKVRPGEIKLHRAKYPWRPSRFQVKPMAVEDDKEMELFMKTRGILNKLTPENFQTIVSQMQALPIDTENKLNGVIDLVFEKVYSGPDFSFAYASMCRYLTKFKVPSDTRPGEKVKFRTVLLTRCQREFEKNKSSQALFSLKYKDIEKYAKRGKKKELFAELAYQEMIAKERSLGNIIFMGELFKLKMLTENKIHPCMFKLLRRKDSESLECLCRLLTTIGKELDTDKAKNRMDQYFRQIFEIIRDKKSPIPSRVKFMLQDVMELRLSEWVPRRVEQEAQERDMCALQAKFNKSAPGKKGHRGPRDQQRGEGANEQRTPLTLEHGSIQRVGHGRGATKFSGLDPGKAASIGRTSKKKKIPNTPTKPAELYTEKMEKKTIAILDEYLKLQDIREVRFFVTTCVNPANHHQFVSHAISHVLKGSTIARKRTGHLLHDLVKQGIITEAAYIKGLVEQLRFAEDLEIDIPMIWQNYGELIHPLIHDNSVTLIGLKQACQPLMISNNADKLVAEVLKDASQREKLEFTIGGNSAPTTPTTGLPLLEIAEKLEGLIVDQQKNNEAVFDWIESYVDEPTTKKANFIRALMTAVCKSAIKGDKGKEKVELKEVAGRNDLLQKYLDHQAYSELQALYALQALVTKLGHPQGVLRAMFDSLYDNDIISEEAFIQWEKSEDEAQGKDAALKQVFPFFKWLKKAEDDR